MSVAHLVVVPEASVVRSDLTPRDEVGHLVYDHEKILRLAVDTLRGEYAAAPDPEGLLGSEFTLLELLRLHLTITGETLGKDTFRRRMIGQLEETGEYQQGVVGKPAKLFRRKAELER